ncbi:MAG: EF-P lysine aminoacylase GenX [Desulfobacterales bacterium]|nr:EF-P lysine aminoacylase GenX [Desulfobacterales bacterium]
MYISRQAKIKENIVLRSKMIYAIRLYFLERNFLEVETPIRIPMVLPEAHIEPQSSESWFLQTSPEMCMKILLAAGYSKIFQICKVFRKKERGKKHLPEFTMLEWYVEYYNYLDLMEQCEELIKFTASSIGFNTNIPFAEKLINIDDAFAKIPVKEAFDVHASISMEDALKTDRFDEIMGLEIEPKLGWDKPVFIYDYPYQKASFAKLKQDNSNFAERFELYIGGIEICNGFTEVNDKEEQEHRFKNEISNKKDTAKCPYPENFLKALSVMPDAAGIAVGMDRLLMVFADTLTIDDVVSFVPEEI